MNNTNKKILVTSVSAWSDSIGSNTMSELFREYDKEKLACLYIRADISDSVSCRRYFHIYEGRVIKSIIRRGMVTGEGYNLGACDMSTTDLDEEKTRYNKFRRKKNWFFIFVRELVWLLGRWKTKELNAFLEDFKPDIVFFSIESYIHFNSINEYIIKKCHPEKVIGYLWDDNFTFKQHPCSFGYKIHRLWLRQGVKRLVHKCDTVFAICPKMKQEVDAEFGIKSILLTKPINQFSEIKTAPQHYPIKIMYTGKLFYGRDATIAEIVDAIKEINKNGQKILLQIYTNTELSPAMQERICVDGCCEMKGFVPQSEVLKIQKEADVLLYAESLSDTYLTARLSFSTKMTDYLASGVCIWGVGNKDLAPIAYLKEEDAGLVSFDRATIKEALTQMTQTLEIIHEYATKAQQCGKKNHNAELIQNILFKAIK